jgi:hypothetical protein
MIFDIIEYRKNFSKTGSQDTVPELLMFSDLLSLKTMTLAKRDRVRNGSRFV